MAIYIADSLLLFLSTFYDDFLFWEHFYFIFILRASFF